MTNHNIFRSSDWEPVPDGAIRAKVSRQAIHQAIKRGTIRSMRLGKRNTLVYLEIGPRPVHPIKGSQGKLMDSISFHVYGLPKPKGSTTRMPNGAMLPAGTANSRKAFSQWRTDIRDCAIVAMGEREASRQPIRLMCEFLLPYPTSSIRKYQMGWLPHTKQPDVDKLMRALLDALTGIVWVDDSQVCYSMVNKVYAWDGRPGAEVIIDFIDDETAVHIARGAQRIREAMS